MVDDRRAPSRGDGPEVRSFTALHELRRPTSRSVVASLAEGGLVVHRSQPRLRSCSCRSRRLAAAICVEYARARLNGKFCRRCEEALVMRIEAHLRPPGCLVRDRLRASNTPQASRPYQILTTSPACSALMSLSCSPLASVRDEFGLLADVRFMQKLNTSPRALQARSQWRHERGCTNSAGTRRRSLAKSTD